jgi:hypothetical protein
MWSSVPRSRSRLSRQRRGLVARRYAIADLHSPIRINTDLGQFQYRLTCCPELSLGLFTQPTKAEWANDSKRPQRKLIAHIVSTRTAAPCVNEASMALPSNWKSTAKSSSSVPSKDKDDSEPQGHQQTGGTICLHSLAVSKQYQKMGLGTVLMKSYIQRIKDSKIADRIALLAHDHLIKFYEGMGFENMGESNVTSCGGGWNNMVSDTSLERRDQV